MGLPSATAFHFGQGHSQAVFNPDFNSRRDQKRARQIHTLERVATLFLGLRHDARNAPSCFKSSPETMNETTKRKKDDTNIDVLNSCVESLLLKQNPTLIHLRPAKSFVSRAAQGSNCQKWDCQALPLFTLDKAIPRLFSILILIAGATKNGRAKSIRWSVWQPCFWGCDMTLGMPPAASKVHQKQ